MGSFFYVHDLSYIINIDLIKETIGVALENQVLFRGGFYR
jgi:hypothetical protein